MSIIVLELKPQACSHTLLVMVLAACMGVLSLLRPPHCYRVCPDGSHGEAETGRHLLKPVSLLSWCMVRGPSPPSAQPNSEGSVAAMPSMWHGQPSTAGRVSISSCVPQSGVSLRTPRRRQVWIHTFFLSFIPHHPLKKMPVGRGPSREREVATPKCLPGKDTGPGRH